MSAVLANMRGAGRLAAAPWFTSMVTVVLLLAMLVVGGQAYEGLLSLQVMLNLLIDNAFLLVIAIGMCFVILSGGIDLSVGAVLALATMIAAWLLQAGWPPLAVIATVLLGGALFGGAMGAIIHVFRLQPFIVTLAGMFLARGLCYLISIESITIDNPLFVAMSQTQLPFLGGFLSPGALIALLMLALAVWVAHYSSFGRAVYAVGGNEQSAEMMGLSVGRTKIGVYAFSGFCAALAGVLFSFYMLSGYGLHAQGTELDAIAAVVIGGASLMGGRGSVWGTALGLVLIQTLNNGLDILLVPSYWQNVITGLLIVFAVAVDVWTTRRQQ